MESSGESLLRHWRSLPALGQREVQLFALRSEGEPELLARAERLLSAEERERAGRIRVPLARSEFVVGRAALRVLAGAATGVAPEAVRVQVDAFGKPVIAGVHSSVSHSRGLIYVALCREAEVGVDVEWIDPAIEVLEIADANFALEEMARLATEPAGWQRARAFCKLWTRKEAIAKAYGQGLRVPLRDIVVPDSPRGQGWILTEEAAERRSEQAPREFFVRELAAPQGYAAALAMRGAERQVNPVIIS